MKFISLTSVWISSLLAMLLLTSSVSLVEADPTDDLSLMLGASLQGEIYSLVSEEQVSHILEDRLDFFPKSQAPRLARHLLALSHEFRLDPAFILSLIEVESSFRIKAVSPVGALGLMQLMPSTAIFVLQNLKFRFSGYEYFQAQDLSQRQMTAELLMDPFINTAIGIAYLAWLREHYKGRLPYHVLAAYNVGPGRLNDLLARKALRPSGTRKYFHAIRRGVPSFRFYQKKKDSIDI